MEAESNFELIEQELEKERKKNSIIRLLSTELNRPTNLTEKLNKILQLLDEYFNLKHTMLLLPDPEQQKLKLAASRGFSDNSTGAEISFGEGIIGIVAAKRRKLRMANIRRHKEYLRWAGPVVEQVNKKTLPGLTDVESQIAFPLLANEELVAVLSAESMNINFFSNEDEEFLMTLSQLIAIAIQNSLMIHNLEQKVKERTEALEDQKFLLEKANRSKDRLFSILGHDLRSPAAALQNVSELINYYQKKGNTKYLYELGGKIVKSARNMNSILDNLLNWSVSQTGQIQISPEIIQIEQLLEQVLELFEDTIQTKEIKIDYTLDFDHPVCLDKNSVLTIFRNLISNALKFSHPGGCIQIRIQKTGDKIQFDIIDNGVGIEAGKMTDLFELNSNKSTKGTYEEKGIGLGLVIVYELVKLNNGYITMDSDLGKGTKVHLSLPENVSEE